MAMRHDMRRIKEFLPRKEGGGSQDCRLDGPESWFLFSCILQLINTETFRIDLLCCVGILDMIMHL